MQRVRIGLTGLAFVFLAVLLAAIFTGQSADEAPITPNSVERQRTGAPAPAGAAERAARRARSGARQCRIERGPAGIGRRAAMSLPLTYPQAEKAGTQQERAPYGTRIEVGFLRVVARNP